jgi:hypothetical protein
MLRTPWLWKTVLAHPLGFEIQNATNNISNRRDLEKDTENYAYHVVS